MPDKSYVHIGHQLHQARRQKDLTQAEVAKRADTTVNHYAKIERGEVVPSLKTLEKIIKALGVKSSDVLPF
jgi:transcriptional regulator with XRE-family HTH domain